jgi:hypothetical protein
LSRPNANPTSGLADTGCALRHIRAALAFDRLSCRKPDRSAVARLMGFLEQFREKCVTVFPGKAHSAFPWKLRKKPWRKQRKFREQCAVGWDHDSIC